MTTDQTYEWEPSYGFTRTDPVQLAAALEAVRRRICAYGPLATTCDCKYGLGESLTDGKTQHVGSERTGCPELRSAIRALLHPEDVGSLLQILAAAREGDTDANH